MIDATNEAHRERNGAQGEEQMDDAILSPLDDIEALFEDDDHFVALAADPKPDPQPNPK